MNKIKIRANLKEITIPLLLSAAGPSLHYNFHPFAIELFIKVTCKLHFSVSPHNPLPRVWPYFVSAGLSRNRGHVQLNKQDAFSWVGPRIIFNIIDQRHLLTIDFLDIHLGTMLNYTFTLPLVFLFFVLTE